MLRRTGKKGAMDRQGGKLPANIIQKSVISFLLSGINIYLAASLEIWTKTAKRGMVCAFMAAGMALFCFLTARFLCLEDRRLKAHALLWGIPMAASYVLGCRMRRDGTALPKLGQLPEMIFQILCLTAVTAACIALLLEGGKKRSSRKPGRTVCRIGLPGRLHQSFRLHWLFYALIIFLCWIPVFLAYYPSVFAYDAEGQLYQVIAHDYSTHHPLLHTLFLGAFFRLGGKLGSYQIGMAFHSVVQMVMMAGTFGYILAYLYRKGVAACQRIMLLLFYALFPVHSVLALSTTKDVLFSAIVLLHTCSICRIVSEQEECADDAMASADRKGAVKRFGKKEFSGYVLWAVLLLFFRNNAVYAFVLSVPAVCFGLRKVNGDSVLWKKYLVCAGAALALFGIGHNVLKAVTDAHSGSPRELLSVPLQQMARTRVKAEETLSAQMRRELDQYLPSEWVFAAYDPHLADPVKNRAVIHDNPAGLIRAWAELGLEHPQIYVDAFLDNSIGYWFLEDRTHAQIYGIGTESGFGYLSTDNRTMPAGCEIVEHSYLPGFRACMEQIVSENCYQKIPVVRLIFAPAFYWWMLCMYMAAVLYTRQYRLLLPAVFLVLYYMTLLLSPTVLIRYMYPFVATVPPLCCLLSAERNKQEPSETNRGPERVFSIKLQRKNIQ